MFDSNRRKYPRANYPCFLTIWHDDGFTDTTLANTCNIGVGGLAVKLDHDLPAHSKVGMQINFTVPTTLFKCAGIVLRSNKEAERIYHIAIQFDPMDEVKHAFLEAKVAELLELEKKGNNS